MRPSSYTFIYIISHLLCKYICQKCSTTILTSFSSLIKSILDSKICKTQQYLFTSSGFRINTDICKGLQNKNSKMHFKTYGASAQRIIYRMNYLVHFEKIYSFKKIMTRFTNKTNTKNFIQKMSN